MMSENNDNQTRVDMTPVAPAEAPPTEPVPEVPAEPPVQVQPVFLADPLTHMRECARVAHEQADREQMLAGRHSQQAEVHGRLATAHAQAAAANRQIARQWEEKVAEEEQRQVLRAQQRAAEEERQRVQGVWGRPNPASFGAPELPYPAALAQQREQQP